MRHGFLLIDKPEGPSSHAAVSAVRKALGERKVGHLGTLDPLASGLLVLAVGQKALKVVELFDDLDKSYETEIRLGATSTTYDREGVIEERELLPGRSAPTQTEIQNLIRSNFIGEVDQVPPAYSAVKVGGERAYRKMRQGKGVDLPARTIEIHDCRVVKNEYPELRLHIDCGSGTYIRSIAHDLGEALRCGGYLQALRRTSVGPWFCSDAVSPEDADWSKIIPLKEVMVGFDRIEIDDIQLEMLVHGKDIPFLIEGQVIAWHDDKPVAVLEKAAETGFAHGRKVLV